MNTNYNTRYILNIELVADKLHNRAFMAEYETDTIKLDAKFSAENIIVFSDSHYKNPDKWIEKSKYNTFEELCKEFSIEQDLGLWEVSETGEKLNIYVDVVEDTKENKNNESQEITEFKQDFKYSKDGLPNANYTDNINEKSDITKMQEEKTMENPIIHTTNNGGTMEHEVPPLNLTDNTATKFAEATAKATVEAFKEKPLQVEIIDNKDKKVNTDNIENDTEEDNTPYAIDDFNKNVHGVDADVLCKLLKIKKALLLVSPPGTGKTTTAIELSKLITGVVKSNRVKLVSFNQSTSYSDIIGGLQNVSGEWVLVKGSLADIADKANTDKENIYIYIIDEINRANTESVIGEAMTALAKRGETVYTNIKTELVIPDNLYIIATMNSTDASVANLDSATLDRFVIYEMPQIDIKADVINNGSIKDENLKKAVNKVIKTIKNINELLSKDIYKGKENTIGLRALYTDYNTIDELKLIIKYDIEPKVKIRMTNLSEAIQESINSKLAYINETLNEDFE